MSTTMAVTAFLLCLAGLLSSPVRGATQKEMDTLAEACEIPTGARCPVRRKMEVLPGRGWDNLRNKDMGQVLLIDYSNCKTTEDGLYLLPNDVHVSPIKQSDLKLTSELIQHWSNYTSITARSFKTNAGADIGAWSVAGSFSIEYDNVKLHQVQDKSQTTRVELRNTMYSVQASPASQLEPSLKKQFLQVMHELENENTEKADVLLELIVRDYGTHYITQAEAGATLYQEDFVTTQFVNDQMGDTTKVTTAAGVSFLEKFGFGVEYTQEVDQSVLQGYRKNQTSSTVSAVGGRTVTANMSVKTWSEGLIDNLVMIDRFGDPLSYLIEPGKFENVSLTLLGRLRVEMEDAIKRYYDYNTHRGCVSLDSPNFDYTANVDDGSCKSPVNNYTFGGTFQDCTPLKTDAGDLCENLIFKNPLTQALSCPDLYEPVPLLTGTKALKTPGRQCDRVCSYFVWIPYHCKDECYSVPNQHESQAEYRAFWCAARGSVPADDGYMFGGLYTSILNNPVTKARNCPATYLTLQIGQDLKICVSSDYELGFKYSVPFSGFFSCSSGNPLVTNWKNPLARSCPGGYSQHMAAIDNDCEINYCVKANAFGGFGQITVIRPPFTDISYLYQRVTPLGHMKKASPVTDTLSGGSIALIVVSCVVTVLAGVGAVALFRKRQRNAAAAAASTSGNTSEEESHRPLLSPEANVPINSGSSYGAINEPQSPLDGVQCEA